MYSTKYQLFSDIYSFLVCVYFIIFIWFSFVFLKMHSHQSKYTFVYPLYFLVLNETGVFNDLF